MALKEIGSHDEMLRILDEKKKNRDTKKLDDDRNSVD